MTRKCTFKRTAEDAYAVHVGQTLLGTVYRAWARVGGWGWTYAGRPGHWVWPTRAEAAAALVRAREAMLAQQLQDVVPAPGDSQ